MAQVNSTKRARKTLADSGDLETQIASLAALDPAVLAQNWRALFGAEPSPLLGRVFMIKAIAYRLQERAFGGLKPSTQRLLDRVCDEGSPRSKRMPKPRPDAGTVLIREWRGVSHRVTVLDNDVVYQGRRYKSLSEVARVITGTHWSGPLFFGLKGRTKEVVNG